MKLDSKILNKLMNSDIIKSVYPMTDRIETEVKDDGDIDYPLYTIIVKIFLNDETITSDNMYQKGMDPHYLVDFYMVDLLKFVSITTRDIEQVYINVYNTKEERIYPS